MKMFRWILLCDLAACALTAESQSKPKPPYHVCREPSIAGMAVGEVPDKPFTAKVVVRPVREDGAGKVIMLPGNPAKDGTIARDRYGVVVVKLKNLHPDEANSAAWTQTICDPIRAERTLIWQRPGHMEPAVAVSSDFNVAKKLTNGTTDLFQSEHLVSRARTELGSAVFEGLKVSHYNAQMHGSGYVLDDWLTSDEMSMHVSEIWWKDDPKVGIFWRMEDIRQVEPDKSLMRPAPSAQTLPLSMAPAWMGLQPGIPVCAAPMCGP